MDILPVGSERRQLTLDRRLLGPLVFASPARLQALNAIVWPAIEGAIVQALRDEATRWEAAADDSPCGPLHDAPATDAVSGSGGGGEPVAVPEQPPPPPVRVDGGLVAVVEAAVLLEAGWADKVSACRARAGCGGGVARLGAPSRRGEWRPRVSRLAHHHPLPLTHALPREPTAPAPRRWTPCG